MNYQILRAVIAVWTFFFIRRYNIVDVLTYWWIWKNNYDILSLPFWGYLLLGTFVSLWGESILRRMLWWR